LRKLKIIRFTGVSALHAPKEEIADRRSWNKTDLEEIRRIAVARVQSEIKRRMPLLGLDERDKSQYVEGAEEFISDFISRIERGAQSTQA
jgi:hypothetical protein